MPELSHFILPALPVFFFVVATLTASAAGRVPLKAILALSFILTLCLAPLVGKVVGTFAVFTQHTLAGLALGFMVRLIFAAVEGMAELVGLSMGLSFSSLFDTQMTNDNPLVNFYRSLALLLFFNLGGHTLCVVIMARVLTHLPQSLDSALHATLMGGEFFANSFLLAAPIVSPLLFLHVALGMIGRTTVPLNLFSLGFPLLLGLGVILLYMSLAGFASSFASLLGALFSQFQ